ncbi:MAG: flagellar export chaperone FliS [Clostridia bacterium]|nr:flagellar export chaperone FliS [Clostridia bacterium]MCL6521056.1 flagellar export chaperone FliS [Bacillota bacterium]
MNGGLSPAGYGQAGAGRSRAYERAEVLTASPVQLVAIVFRILEREVTAARLCRERQEAEEMRQHTGKAKEALQLLRQSLDFRRGGEVAARLEALYAFLYERLVRAELRPASDALDGLLDVIAPLREAWERLAAGTGQARGGASAHPSAAAARSS